MVVVPGTRPSAVTQQEETAFSPTCSRSFACQTIFSQAHLSSRGIPQACMWSTPLPHQLPALHFKAPSTVEEGPLLTALHAA